MPVDIEKRENRRFDIVQFLFENNDPDINEIKKGLNLINIPVYDIKFSNTDRDNPTLEFYCNDDGEVLGIPMNHQVLIDNKFSITIQSRGSEVKSIRLR